MRRIVHKYKYKNDEDISIVVLVYDEHDSLLHRVEIFADGKIVVQKK